MPYMRLCTLTFACFFITFSFGCGKKSPEKLTASTFVFHHTDSVYANVGYTTTLDTIHSTGIYTDTTMAMTIRGSQIFFNGDTLMLDSIMGGTEYYHYNSPVLIFHPWMSVLKKDAGGNMDYIRRLHVAASATSIEHLWR